MQPVMVSNIPELTILYISKRVLGSTAFSYKRHGTKNDNVHHVTSSEPVLIANIQNTYLFLNL